MRTIPPKLKKGLLILLLILLIVTAAGSVWYYQKSEALNREYEAKLDEALSKYESHEYAAAVKLFNDASEIRPGAADPYYGVIRILIDKNLNSKALELAHSSETVLSRSEQAKIFANLGKALVQDGEYESGVEQLEKSYELNSEENDIVPELFLAYVRAGKLEEAAELYSSNSDTIQSSETTKKLSESWELYTKWVENSAGKNPQEVDLFAMMKDIRTCINAGFPHLALALFPSIESAIDEYADAQFYWGRAQFDIAEYSDAILRLGNATSLGMNDPVLYIYLARSQIRGSDLDSAIASYEKAILYADPAEKAQYVGEYIEILISQGQYAKAVDQLSNSDLDQNLSLYYQFLIDIEKEDYELAGEHLIESDINNPLSPLLQRNYDLLLFEYYINKDQGDKARVLADKFLAQDSEDPHGYYMMGAVLQLEGDLEAAEQQLSRAIDLDLDGEVAEKAEKLINEL